MHVIDLTVFQDKPYSYVRIIEGSFLHPHKDEDLK